MNARRPSLVLSGSLVMIAGLVLASGCGRDNVNGWVVSPESSTESAVRREPEATSPTGTIRLLQWCWNRRQLDPYLALFTDDYRAGCVGTDAPVLSRYHEFLAARTLFDRIRGIRLDFAGKLVALPDPRPGKTATWHQVVSARTRMMLVERGGHLQWIDEGVAFFLVRGDSALIPPDLAAEGFRPDTSRWFIERWEAYGIPAELRQDGPRRAQRTTWCELKREALGYLGAFSSGNHAEMQNFDRGDDPAREVPARRTLQDMGTVAQL
jgi:hypothetical protein